MKKRIVALLLCLALLSGCGDEAKVQEKTTFVKELSGKTSMLSEAKIDYEVPGAYPGICVDLNGYELNKSKEAILAGENLPAVFVIKDANTHEEVYRGSVKRKPSIEEDSKLTGVADFSDFSTAGCYYIEAELLGKSKSFFIREFVYEDTLLKAFSKLHELRCDNCHVESVPFESDLSVTMDVSGGWHTADGGQKDVVEACLSVMDLCTAYEFYPSAFTDDYGYEFSGNKIPDILDEAAFEIEWLLKMQNQETGGVYTSVSLQNLPGEREKKLAVGGETTRATAYFCACLAKFSMDYKQFDQNLSQKAFQAASKAWKCLEANKDIVTSDQMYRAAAEMFKATGNGVYNQIILDYLELNAGAAYDGRATLDAAITYLSTSRGTNRTYCALLMNSFKARIKAKADAGDKARFGIDPETTEVVDQLRNAYEMMLCDYIDNSKEYEESEEDYIHYLLGRNAFSEKYIESVNSPNAYAELIAVAAKLNKSVKDKKGKK